MMRPLAALSVALLAAPAADAQSARVCIEEVGGVCLKYQEAPERVISPAEAEERALRLNAGERRRAQSGLRRVGVYDGAIDGAFGPQSRRAIADWQATTGAPRTGYLNRAQFDALIAEAEAAESEAAPAAAAETAAPEDAAPHPQPGRVYAESRSTLQGSQVTASVRRIDDAKAELTLRVESTTGVLEDSCEIEIDGAVACYMRKSGWNMIYVSGRLPRINATETEVRQSVPIRLNSETFQLW